MRFGLFCVLFGIFMSLGGCISHAMPEPGEILTSDRPAAGGGKQNVLIELFTSEGCSSCPPADKVLTYLDREPVVPNVNIITLGLHVDYWDRASWRDRFSSNLFTQRQEAYARQFRIDSTYTPQLVVDGSTELVGSNSGGAVTAIQKSSSQAKGNAAITISGGQVHIKIDNLPEHSEATVYLATAESKLSSSVTGGENGGSKLDHTSVVRQLMIIGNIPSKQNTLAADQPLPADPAWKRENLKFVVFVQDNTTLKILAVGQTFEK